MSTTSLVWLNGLVIGLLLGIAGTVCVYRRWRGE